MAWVWWNYNSFLITYPETTFPPVPTWSQNFSSIWWNMNGWLHNFRNCTIVFIKALAPPLPLLPFSEPSVNKTPLDCMCLEEKRLIVDSTWLRPMGLFTDVRRNIISACGKGQYQIIWIEVSHMARKKNDDQIRSLKKRRYKKCVFEEIPFLFIIS